MNMLTLDAVVENISHVIDFVNSHLEGIACPIKVRMQIDIAIDELFSNIAQYAYSPNVGSVTVAVSVCQNPASVVISFMDHGIPYDPLAKRDPDTTLSANERKIGGLGIYLVKKSMDDIQYEYRDGQNILRIFKRF